MRTRTSNRLRTKPSATCLTLAGLTLLGVLCAPAQAQQSSAIIDDLLDKLKDKGVLSQDEYDALKQAREEEKGEQRATRRKQALKTAQEEEKKEKAAEMAKTTVTGRFKDGVTFETGDKTAAISLGGRIHADYRSYANSDATADTFDLRRAYLTLTGKMYDYVTFDLTGDFANQVNNSQLDVAWINVAPWKEAQFRIGQFKMPFSLEELGSSRFLDFQERSLVNGLHFTNYLHRFNSKPQ
jgi:phosphate-selective porin OprO/OprP